jgi:hypothetical protein
MDLLRGAVRVLPQDEAPVVAPLLSLCSWCRGDGARANVAIDVATAVDAAHPTVSLVADVLAAGVPPAVVRATLRRATAA